MGSSSSSRESRRDMPEVGGRKPVQARPLGSGSGPKETESRTNKEGPSFVRP